MKAVNVDTVAATMRDYLERTNASLLYNDPADGKTWHVGTGVAAAVDGLLPAIVVAGQSVWRDLTGKGFALDLARDPEALFGYRLRGIGGPTFSIVMLASLEALDQVRHPEGFIVNGFNALWASATRHDLESPYTDRRTTAEARPYAGVKARSGPRP
jgi:hypothetical protein